MQKEQKLETLIPYLIFGAILVVWEFICQIRLVNPIILPSPSRIISTLMMGAIDPKKIGYPIFIHAAHTLIHLVIGFAIGVIVGVGGGIAIGFSATLHRIVNPILSIMLPIPAISWAPIAMIWIGMGTPAILAIVSFACFSEVIYNTATGIRGISKLYVWQIKSFGATPFVTFRYTMLPAAFPSTLAGIRLGFAASWRSLVGSEMFAGVNWGLGFLLFEAEQFYATDVMFSSLVIVAVLSLFLEQGFFRGVERRTLVRWGMARTLEA